MLINKRVQIVLPGGGPGGLSCDELNRGRLEAGGDRVSGRVSDRQNAMRARARDGLFGERGFSLICERGWLSRIVPLFLP